MDLEAALTPPLLQSFPVSHILDRRGNLNGLVHVVAKQNVHDRRLYL